jgi:hypothetical protein
MWKGEWKAYAAWLALPVVGTIGALIAVSLSVAKPATITADPWYAPAPPGGAPSPTSRVPSARILEIQPNQLAEAERMLANAPTAELAPADVERLTDQQTAYDPNRRSYLVRALAHDGPDCAFQVHAEGGVVEVAHGCLARSALPLRHRPLVLSLEQRPSTLYVTASVAE